MILSIKRTAIAAVVWLLMPRAVYAEAGFLHYPSARTFRISCDFACYRNHRAIDFAFPRNTEVRAAAEGIIERVQDGIPPAAGCFVGVGYGNFVRMRHPNGYRTIYGHLIAGTLEVRAGDTVAAGAILGRSDDTGYSCGHHLHFEVRDSRGRKVNPYGDPPNYESGCGTNALWVTCPPTPAPPPDADGDGYTAAAGDCDDTNRDVHPGAPERCNNRDDDCDGTTDDPWHIGLAQDVGNSCTAGIGSCANTGTWMCAPDGRATVCSVDPLPPQLESCNGLDDNCNDETDENWRVGLAQDVGNPCTINWGPTCGSSSGVWTCAPDGRATVCDARERPSSEICNDQDDDCNGTTDDVGPATMRTDFSNCGACGHVCRGGETCGGGYCRCAYPDLCREWCEFDTCGCDNSGACRRLFDDCMAGCNTSRWDPTVYATLCSQGCAGTRTWPP